MLASTPMSARSSSNRNSLESWTARTSGCARMLGGRLRISSVAATLVIDLGQALGT